MKFYVNNMLTIFDITSYRLINNTASTKDSNSCINRKHPEWIRIKKRINGPKYFIYQSFLRHTLQKNEL